MSSNSGNSRKNPNRNAKLVESYNEHKLTINAIRKFRAESNKMQTKNRVIQNKNNTENKSNTLAKGVSQDDINISLTHKLPEVKSNAVPTTTSSPIADPLSSTMPSPIAAPLTPTVTAPLPDTSDKKNNKAIYKIFPSSYPNNRGRYVGKEYVQLLKDPSFMDHFDDVDFYMNSLFKNMVNDLTDEKSGNKKTPRSILPYFEKVIQFDPTTYSKTGGKKSRKHRKTYKKNKNQKRRTYKKK